VVAEKISRYAALNIDNLQLNMNFGAPHEQVMRSLELFATRVMPNIHLSDQSEDETKQEG
jgi:hypothetical protein